MKLTEAARVGAIWIILNSIGSYCHAQTTVRVPTPSAAPAAPAAAAAAAAGAAGATPAAAAAAHAPPAKPSGKDCWFIPTRGDCMDAGGKDNKYANINTFYGTAGNFSYFNQIKSIYNAASGSATVSADLASLNFSNGMEVIAGTNVQAGSSSPTNVASGMTPTLSASAAGQATQNMLYGGTLFAAALYPLIAYRADQQDQPGNFGLYIDLVGKEGVDIQNFKSGTNVNVTAPPSHSAAQIEGYLLYNSVNLATGSSISAGAIFLGGSYGYSYTSHGYFRDYGFGNNVSRGLGQISFGILINNVAKIAVSRGFGPSQTYIDSTSMVQTTVNNFKSWSIGITYQAAPAK